MLRGNIQARVDEKGRLKIPAAFLEELKGSGERYYVTSETGESAKIYPMKTWEEVEAKLARLSLHDEARQKYLDVTGYFGQEMGLDNQGRILIPPVLREEAQLKGDVNVLGRLSYLEVKNHDRQIEQMRKNRLTKEDFQKLADVGI